MKRRPLFVPLPLSLGLAASVLIRHWSANPIFYARADTAALATLAGLLLTLFLTAWYVAHGLPERARRASLAQAQAQAAEDRRRFLQRLDHELKNPLTALRAALANLAGAPTDAARREALTSVETPGSAPQPPGRRPAQTGRIGDPPHRTYSHKPDRPVGRGVGAGPGATGGHGASPEPDSPSRPLALPTITGDRDLLLLAVHNLPDNTLKFTRPGDTVELRL